MMLKHIRYSDSKYPISLHLSHIRWISSITGFILLLSFLFLSWTSWYPIYLTQIVFCLIIYFSLRIIFLMIKEIKYIGKPLSYGRWTIDILLLSIFVYYTGGQNSLFYWLYFMIIAAGSGYFGYRVGFFIASLSTIFYCSAVFLHFITIHSTINLLSLSIQVLLFFIGYWLIGYGHKLFLNIIAQLQFFYWMDRGRNLEFDRSLKFMLEEFLSSLKANSGSIWLLDEFKNELFLKVYQGPDREIKKENRIKVGEGMIGEAAQKGEPVWRKNITISELAKEPYYKLFPEIKSCLILPLTTFPEKKVIGVFSINSTKPKILKEPHEKLLQYFAKFIADSVETAIREEKIKKRMLKLSMEEKVNEVLTAFTRDIDKGTDAIVDSSLELFDVKHTVSLLLMDKKRENLIIAAGKGPNFTKEMIGQNIRKEKGITGWVVQTGRPFLCNDVELYREPTKKPCYYELSPDVKSELAVPLIVNDKIIGVLNMEGTAKDIFEEIDLKMLSDFANRIAPAINNAIEYNQLLDKVKEQAKLPPTLYKISDLMPLETSKLNELFYYVLTIATAEEGLGFNRAMLLLADEKKEFLKGEMGIGPIDEVEAKQIWDTMEKGNIAFEEYINQYERVKEHIYGKEINKKIREVNIPFDERGGIFASKILDKRPFTVENSKSYPEIRDSLQGLEADTFVMVPLVVNNNPIGIILVDNKINGEPIDDVNVNILSILAKQTAMVIDRIRIMKEVEKEKSVVWGKISARAAHKIGNPLFALASRCGKLKRSLTNAKLEKPYLDHISVMEELMDDIKEILSEFTTLTIPLRLRIQKLSINNLLKEVVSQLISPPIKIKSYFILDDNLPLLDGDYSSLKQAFSELIGNSKNFIPAEGELTVTVTTKLIPSIESHSYGLSDKDYCKIEITDTGVGVPLDFKKRIFEPFFGTREEGSGLGLSIVKHIIDTHDGEISEDGIPGKGAKFTIFLPIEQKKERNGE